MKMEQIAIENTDSGTTPDLDTEILTEDLASPCAKLVYLYLAVAEGGSLDELHDTLGVARLDLLGILDSLSKAEHISCDGDRYYPT